MMNLLCRAGISLITLLHPPVGDQLTWRAACVIIFSFLTCTSLIFLNLRQALKLTKTCKELRNIGHELMSLYSPSGNSDSDKHELDELNMLLLYTSTLDMEAKILKIPVRDSFLSCLMVTLTFMLLLLAQFGHINF